MGMSSSERLSLLNKLNSSNANEIQQANTNEIVQSKDDIPDLNLRLKKESFFLRLLLKIKSFLSNTSTEYTYNKYLLSNIAHEVQTKNPSLLDTKTMELLNNFYENLKTLKQVSEYFKMGVAIYEEDPGNFLTFMGSLIFTDLEERFEENSNPYKYPFDQEIPGDLRANLLRHMEEILQSVPSDQKSRMYVCVQSVNWIKQFTHLPFDRLLSKFRPSAKGEFTCQVDSIQHELTTICNVMCAKKQFYNEVFESLFLLTYQSEHKKKLETIENSSQTLQLEKNKANSDDIQEQEKVSAECNSYIEKSLNQISLVNSFLKNVPIIKITKLSQNSSSWVPDRVEGMEDWFVKFKAQWRKIFDKTWANWLKDRSRYQVLQSIKTMFNCEDFPTIEHRPWTQAWDGIPFSKEYSLGFLFAFFQKLYPEYMRSLRIITTEGQFVKRENQEEFTENYNTMNSLHQGILNLNNALSPEGSYGEVFASVKEIQARTIQNYSKITSLIATIESEAQTLAIQFKSTSANIIQILNGILAPTKNSKYDTLANLATIQGPLNDKFRRTLEKIRENLENCSNLLNEIQNIEAQ